MAAEFSRPTVTKGIVILIVRCSRRQRLPSHHCGCRARIGGIREVTALCAAESSRPRSPLPCSQPSYRSAAEDQLPLHPLISRRLVLDLDVPVRSVHADLLPIP